MEIKQLPVSSVKPSPMNPRKTFDQAEIQELSENIEMQGLLQPITVRPSGTGYEIVCGERRFRAISILKEKEDAENVKRLAAHRKKSDKFQTISAIVREMTDEEAFDAMITENLQRKDVDPIEEAFAFGQLAKTGKTAEEIATRFGKSIRFVTERIKLNTLIPELMLAVKDDRMPVVAAMIICKLDEAQQQQYYSSFNESYQGFTKSSAQNFVNNLFMDLDKSPWYDSDDKADEDFAGGCERACSQCNLNTANHGCLFYEMKPENSGRCTDREKFQDKMKAFMIHEVERQSDLIVKCGEPLEYGRTVLALKIESYDSESIRAQKESVRELFTERGYEVVDPNKVFMSKCYYRNNDERTLSMIKSGEVYRVLNLFNYSTQKVSEEFWYVKRASTANPQSKESAPTGLPANVIALLDSLKRENDGLKNKLVTECAKTMSAHSAPDNSPLSEIEKKIFCLIELQSNFKLRKSLGIEMVCPVSSYYEYYEKHPDIFNKCVRAFLQSKVALGNNPELSISEPHLDDLGAQWCPEEYEKTKGKVRANHSEAVSKIVGQLVDLGYTPDGKPIIEKENAAGNGIIEAVRNIKAKHPDALAIVRDGDFYMLFNEDAEKAAPILGLNQAPWHLDSQQNQCGFSHKDLDEMVRKLIKAGQRVAICEQLEDPKN